MNRLQLSEDRQAEQDRLAAAHFADIERWIDTACTPQDDARVSTFDMYRAYTAWCGPEGKPVAARYTFGVVMDQLVVPRAKDSIGSYYVGYVPARR